MSFILTMIALIVCLFACFVLFDLMLFDCKVRTYVHRDAYMCYMVRPWAWSYFGRVGVLFPANTITIFVPIKINICLVCPVPRRSASWSSIYCLGMYAIIDLIRWKRKRSEHVHQLHRKSTFVWVHQLHRKSTQMVLIPSQWISTPIQLSGNGWKSYSSNDTTTLCQCHYHRHRSRGRRYFLLSPKQRAMVNRPRMVMARTTTTTTTTMNPFVPCSPDFPFPLSHVPSHWQTSHISIFNDVGLYLWGNQPASIRQALLHLLSLI